MYRLDTHLVGEKDMVLRKLSTRGGERGRSSSLALLVSMIAAEGSDAWRVHELAHENAGLKKEIARLNKIIEKHGLEA